MFFMQVTFCLLSDYFLINFIIMIIDAVIIKIINITITFIIVFVIIIMMMMMMS